jgi:KaiC/GvpD/RAD55 family RecA-like ATPase
LDAVSANGLFSLTLECLLGKSVRAILVKGEPGVGKTTFAIELLNLYGSGIYVSTRVSEEQISEYNPVIKDLVEDSKVLEVKLQHQKQSGQRGKINGKNTKESRNNGRIIFEDLRLGDAHDIIQVLIEGVAKYPKPVIVLDSWDSIAREVDNVERLKVEKSLLALAQANKSKLVFISEEPGLTTTDYLVDAIVTLKNEFLEGGRRIRKIEWNKVRGSPIPQPFYVYSLHNGRFNMFQGPKVLPTQEYDIQPFKSINHKEDFYSTGNHDLDEFLGGGVRKGSVRLVELGKNVTLQEVLPTFGTVMCNMLATGGCNVAIPNADAMPDTALGLVSPYISESIVKSSLRIGIYGEFHQHPCLFALDPSSAAKTYEIFWRVVQSVKGSEEMRPCRWYIGVDALEALYGTDDILKYTMMSIHKVKHYNDFLTLVAKDRTQTKQLLSDLADTHVKFEEVNGALLLYSIKPVSQTYNVDYDYICGYPSPKLTPII